MKRFEVRQTEWFGCNNPASKVSRLVGIYKNRKTAEKAALRDSVGRTTYWQDTLTGWCLAGTDGSFWKIREVGA